MQTNRSLEGRVAVVTGASSGIGHATVRALAARGAQVAAIARRKDNLDALVREVTNAGGKALAIGADVAKREAMLDAARVIDAELGRASLVVNNAGVMLAAPMTERKHDDWARMIDTNVKGVVNVVEAFVGALVASAAEGSAADLVNVSSIGAKGIFPSFAVYCATKAFVTHFSHTVRVELGSKNVRVSVVEPGLVSTELQSHVRDEGANAWLANARETVRWLSAEDIAESIAFFASLPKHVAYETLTIVPTNQA